jgi:hypothetical protein
VLEPRELKMYFSAQGALSEFRAELSKILAEENLPEGAENSLLTYMGGMLEDFWLLTGRLKSGLSAAQEINKNLEAKISSRTTWLSFLCVLAFLAGVLPSYLWKRRVQKRAAPLTEGTEGSRCLLPFRTIEQHQ